jgi:hypothetical protein
VSLLHPTPGMVYARTNIGKAESLKYVLNRYPDQNWLTQRKILGQIYHTKRGLRFQNTNHLYLSKFYANLTSSARSIAQDLAQRFQSARNAYRTQQAAQDRPQLPLAPWEEVQCPLQSPRRSEESDDDPYPTDIERNPDGVDYSVDEESFDH